MLESTKFMPLETFLFPVDEMENEKSQSTVHQMKEVGDCLVLAGIVLRPKKALYRITYPTTGRDNSRAIALLQKGALVTGNRNALIRAGAKLQTEFTIEAPQTLFDKILAVFIDIGSARFDLLGRNPKKYSGGTTGEAVKRSYPCLYVSRLEATRDGIIPGSYSFFIAPTEANIHNISLGLLVD